MKRIVAFIVAPFHYLQNEIPKQLVSTDKEVFIASVLFLYIRAVIKIHYLWPLFRNSKCWTLEWHFHLPLESSPWILLLPSYYPRDDGLLDELAGHFFTHPYWLDTTFYAHVEVALPENQRFPDIWLFPFQWGICL